jgi:hypothetical protein
VRGWGHTTLFSSHFPDQAVALYLLQGTLPDVGTVYDQDFVPSADATTTGTASANAEMQARVTPTMVPNAVRNSVHVKKIDTVGWTFISTAPPLPRFGQVEGKQASRRARESLLRIAWQYQTKNITGVGRGRQKSWFTLVLNRTRVLARQ